MDDLITIIVSRSMLAQLIESADVRADQLDGKGEPYADELDPKTAAHIRKCIEQVGGAVDYNLNQPVIDVQRADVQKLADYFEADAHPQTDSHLAACGPCMMAHDKALPDAGSEPEAEVLDASDVATILAALRLFQREYDGWPNEQIAEAWPDHFEWVNNGDDSFATPEPLGSESIEKLCERINCARVLRIEADRG